MKFRKIYLRSNTENIKILITDAIYRAYAYGSHLSNQPNAVCSMSFADCFSLPTLRLLCAWYG
jgi:hypothetical protein